MNRRRSEDPRPHFFPYLALVFAAAVATTGGAMHAFYRNGQIQVERKIEDARLRIVEHQRDIQLYEVRRERLVDRYLLREALRDLASELVPTRHDVIEKVVPESRPEPAVASRS